MAAYEEQQKLQKEDEASKTKAENGYDRSGHVELLIVAIQTQKCNCFLQDCVPGVAEIEAFPMFAFILKGSTEKVGVGFAEMFVVC